MLLTLGKESHIDRIPYQLLEGVNCPNVKIDTIAILAKALGAKAINFFED